METDKTSSTSIPAGLVPALTSTDGGRPECRVLFIGEVAKRLGCSRKTIERRMDDATFPIPPLPAIDNRHRWSEDAVEAYVRGRLSTQ